MESPRKARGPRPRSEANSSELDRAAVRAAVSDRAFQTIEELRLAYPAGDEYSGLFWRRAREQLVKVAQALPEPALRLLPAKIGRVCAARGMSAEHVRELVKSLDVMKVIEAAELNSDIQSFQAHLEYKNLWALGSIRANPPMRVEFEYAVVLGTISEAGDISKTKSWGRILRLEPLRRDDRLYAMNITYLLKASSRQRMRWEVRDTFKNILGKERGLVNQAMRLTKRRFVDQVTPADTKLISTRLELKPTEFWDAVRHGEKFGPGGIQTFV